MVKIKNLKNATLTGMKDLSIKVQKATAAQSIFTKHRFIT